MGVDLARTDDCMGGLFMEVPFVLCCVVTELHRSWFRLGYL